MMHETFVLSKRQTNTEIITALYLRLGSKQNCHPPTPPLYPVGGEHLPLPCSHTWNVQSSLFLVRAHFWGTDPTYPLLEASVHQPRFWWLFCLWIPAAIMPTTLMCHLHSVLVHLQPQVTFLSGSSNYYLALPFPLDSRCQELGSEFRKVGPVLFPSSSHFIMSFEEC